MIVDDDVYLEHYGKQGMKWGVRRTQKVQAHLDRVAKVSAGTATANERGKVRRQSGIMTKKSATSALRRGAKHQQKIFDGKNKAGEILLNAVGVKIKDLNYHQN